MPILTWTSQLKCNELVRAIDAPDSLSVNRGTKREQRTDVEELPPQPVVYPNRGVDKQTERFMRMEGMKMRWRDHYMDRVAHLNYKDHAVSFSKAYLDLDSSKDKPSLELFVT